MTTYFQDHTDRTNLNNIFHCEFLSFFFFFSVNIAVLCDDYEPGFKLGQECWKKCRQIKGLGDCYFGWNCRDLKFSYY